jgi:2-amino-4-hydroxy-6-hydroxymethyldihydropteridine diphosphokinase
VTKVWGVWAGIEPPQPASQPARENFSVETSARKPDTSSHTVPNLAYLSLGSNVGDREAHLRDALARLGAAGRVMTVSSVYETEPVEFTHQPWFLNCAAALETSQTPEQLVTTILHIEEEMGRRRMHYKGPRSIDIDILLFLINETSDTIVNSNELTIPHPAMHQRRFVLEPLAEIAPDAVHPVVKKTISELRDALPEGQTVRRLPRSSMANDQRPSLACPEQSEGTNDDSTAQ